MISKETLQTFRERYPKGTRVELVQMDDAQAPPVGTKGTVRGVDDMGSIMVAWDNGCGLNVVYGVDICRKVVDRLSLQPFRTGRPSAKAILGYYCLIGGIWLSWRIWQIRLCTRPSDMVKIWPWLIARIWTNKM